MLLQAFRQFRHAIIKARQRHAALVIVKISQDLRQNTVRVRRRHAIKAGMQIAIGGVDDHFLTAKAAQHGHNGGGLRIPHIGIANQADIRLQFFLIGLKEAGQIDATRFFLTFQQDGNRDGQLARHGLPGPAGFDKGHQLALIIRAATATDDLGAIGQGFDHRVKRVAVP